MDSRKRFYRRCIAFSLGVLFIFFPSESAYAFQVDPLPDDNLIQNPWFRSSTNPTRVGMDFWFNGNNYWTLTQKINNPSPDAVISGACNRTTPTYCGTSAKLAADDGNAIVGVDAFLYQVVQSDPAHRKLKFFVHWVAHYVDPFEVKIYGGDTPEGPWKHVWTPMHQVVTSMLKPPAGYDQSWLWIEMTSWTPPVETILPQGYPFYKVELRANLPSPEGFKLTGVYFATENTDEPFPTVSVPTSSPTTKLSPSPTAIETQTHTPTSTTTPETFPPPTSTVTQSPLPTSSPTTELSPSPTAVETQTPEPTNTPTTTPTLDVIFEDDFESGDLSAWSASTTDSGDLSASTAAGLTGNYGMQIVIDDTNPIYVTNETPDMEPRYRVRFYLDPNSISLSDKKAFDIFYAYSGTSKVVLRVELRNAKGSYQLRAGLLKDSNSWASSGLIAIGDTPHLVELDWQAGTSTGANDGHLVLWLDGVVQANITEVDNDTFRIDRVRLGAVAGIDSDTSGAYFIDAFESRRTTYIGPPTE